MTHALARAQRSGRFPLLLWAAAGSLGDGSRVTSLGDHLATFVLCKPPPAEADLADVLFHPGGILSPSFMALLILSYYFLCLVLELQGNRNCASPVSHLQEPAPGRRHSVIFVGGANECDFQKFMRWVPLRK